MRNTHFRTPLFPAPVFFYDIQEIFSIVVNDGTARRSLEYAVEYFKLKKEIKFHRAMSDAYYTALIMSSIDKDVILQNYIFVYTAHNQSCIICITHCSVKFYLFFELEVFYRIFK